MIWCHQGRRPPFCGPKSVIRAIPGAGARVGPGAAFHNVAMKIRLLLPSKGRTNRDVWTMQIDRRITNGLAWAGVILVVGVPAADLLSAQFAGGDAPQVAVISPEVPNAVPAAAPQPSTDVAVATPAVKPAATGGDVVDTFLQSGKPLPSYITGGGAPAPAPVAATPAPKPVVPNQPAKPAEIQQATTTPAARPPIVTDPVQVAALPTPAKVAPVPMPLSMRPKPVIVPVAATTEPVLIVPDRVVAPLPPANVVPQAPVNVTAADLEDWESGPLSEFLAARQQQGGSSATVTYDPNGYYLDEGPNAQRPRRDQLVGPDGEVYYAPFFN